ncbi:MAG TPA: hypothetical protein GXZ98_08450 [Firmicutes bacterium]|jgi:hypothetical protein|nr:hypothetical protein [Bacillota bacterium]
MRKGLYILLIGVFPVFLLLSPPVMMADAYLEFEIPERMELTLSTSVVDLGEPKGAHRLYYERIDAVRVDYRCNSRYEWEVRISAADLRDGNRTIPISRLQWRTSDGTYQYMPENGKYTVLARRRDHTPFSGLKQSKMISYRLELRGDERGGTYSAPVTYTLFVP